MGSSPVAVSFHLFQLLLLIVALFRWLGKVSRLLFCGAIWFQSPTSAVFYGNYSVSSGYFVIIPNYHSCREACFWLTIHISIALFLAFSSISFSILFRCLIGRCLIVLSSFLYLLILTWWCFSSLFLFLCPSFWCLYFQFCLH